jgi:ribosomal-protein-alanine N-acetyltransferase
VGGGARAPAPGGVTIGDEVRTGDARLRLRRVAPGDVAAIAGIERESFSDPWTQESFGHLARRSDVFFRVAESDGAVVGYLVAWFVADEGELANVAVARAARGRGVGAALLDELLAAAAARGVGALFLEVRESNAVARALYAARGFATVGRRRGYYRRPVEDALVLRRVVGDAVSGGND